MPAGLRNWPGPIPSEPNAPSSLPWASNFLIFALPVSAMKMFPRSSMARPSGSLKPSVPLPLAPKEDKSSPAREKTRTRFVSLSRTYTRFRTSTATSAGAVISSFLTLYAREAR
jgi:hypothetical protein